MNIRIYEHKVLDTQSIHRGTHRSNIDVGALSSCECWGERCIVEGSSRRRRNAVLGGSSGNVTSSDLAAAGIGSPVVPVVLSLQRGKQVLIHKVGLEERSQVTTDHAAPACVQLKSVWSVSCWGLRAGQLYTKRGESEGQLWDHLLSEVNLTGPTARRPRSVRLAKHKGAWLADSEAHLCEVKLSAMSPGRSKQCI